jgi:hypothetical protein
MRGLVYESVGKYSYQMDLHLLSEQLFVDDYHTHDFTQLLHFTQAPLPFLLASHVYQGISYLIRLQSIEEEQ